MGDEKRQESILCHFEKSWANPLAGLHFKWVMEDPFTGSTMQSVVRRFLGAFKGHSEKKMQKKMRESTENGTTNFCGDTHPTFRSGGHGHTWFYAGGWTVSGLLWYFACGPAVAAVCAHQPARVARKPDTLTTGQSRVVLDTAVRASREKLGRSLSTRHDQNGMAEECCGAWCFKPNE